MSDIDYEPLPRPTCFEMIIIAATLVISSIFFTRKRKRK